MRFLDYQKVKDVERKKASDLFGTFEKPSALASKVSLAHPSLAFLSPFPLPLGWLTSPQKKIIGIKSRTFDVPSNITNLDSASTTDKAFRVKLTDKEKKRVKLMIQNAKSLQEIARLEKELNEGRIPGGRLGGGGAGPDDDMEED